MTRRTLGTRGRLGLGAALALACVLAACASRPPEKPGVYDAQALLKAAPSLTSVALVDMESRDTLYRFTPAQADSLKAALKRSFVSESLQLTPSPWPVALVFGKGFVALHYGNVLRVNAFHPWSALIADSAGNAPAKGIADIVLEADDADWIWALVQTAMQKTKGTPPSKSYQIPSGIPLKPRY
jgi:hypothetical protein